LNSIVYICVHTRHLESIVIGLYTRLLETNAVKHFAKLYPVCVDCNVHVNPLKKGCFHWIHLWKCRLAK